MLVRSWRTSPSCVDSWTGSAPNLHHCSVRNRPHALGGMRSSKVLEEPPSSLLQRCYQNLQGALSCPSKGLSYLECGGAARCHPKSFSFSTSHVDEELYRNMNTGFCSVEGWAQRGIKKKRIFSSLSKVVEKVPVENFNPLSTQKHCVENGPKGCFLLAPWGTSISRALCQPPQALRAVEKGLPAAPGVGSGGRTPNQSSTNPTVNKQPQETDANPEIWGGCRSL